MLDMTLNQTKFTINLIKSQIQSLIQILIMIIYNEILLSKNKHVPGKLIKFDKYKHKKLHGLLRACSSQPGTEINFINN